MKGQAPISYFFCILSLACIFFNALTIQNTKIMDISALVLVISLVAMLIKIVYLLREAALYENPN